MIMRISYDFSVFYTDFSMAVYSALVFVIIKV